MDEGDGEARLAVFCCRNRLAIEAWGGVQNHAPPPRLQRRLSLYYTLGARA